MATAIDTPSTSPLHPFSTTPMIELTMHAATRIQRISSPKGSSRRLQKLFTSLFCTLFEPYLYTLKKKTYFSTRSSISSFFPSIPAYTLHDITTYCKVRVQLRYDANDASQFIYRLVGLRQRVILPRIFLRPIITLSKVTAGYKSHGLPELISIEFKSIYKGYFYPGAAVFNSRIHLTIINVN